MNEKMQTAHGWIKVNAWEQKQNLSKYKKAGINTWMNGDQKHKQTQIECKWKGLILINASQITNEGTSKTRGSMKK